MFKTPEHSPRDTRAVVEEKTWIADQNRVRVVSNGKVKVLANLDLLKERGLIDPATEQVVLKYADLSADLEGKKYDEALLASPADRIIDQLLSQLASLSAKGSLRVVISRSVGDVNNCRNIWHHNVKQAGDLIEIMDHARPPDEEIVARLINSPKDLISKEFRIDPVFSVLREPGEGAAEELVKAKSEFLQELGFLRPGVSVESLMALPEKGFGPSTDNKTMKNLIWGSGVMRGYKDNQRIVGLSSPMMPNVAAEIQGLPPASKGSKVTFHFNPKAILKSIAPLQIA